jgi:4-hydroxybenzoate polyprenyltransferase
MTPDTSKKKTSDFTRQTVLSIAWNIPVTIALCTLLGYYIGNKAGHKKAGILLGWILGMICVAYEIWKLSRAHSSPPPQNPPPPGESK